MPQTSTQENNFQVLLQPVGSDNWRDVANLQVAPSQKKYVAEPSYYLALCSYGGDWKPLAVHLDEQVIGFMMWATDPADNSCWFGGIIIDQQHQRKGYGKQAVKAAISMFTHEHGYKKFALSYDPDNLIAKHIYSTLGFSETDEREGDEIVARLSVSD